MREPTDEEIALQMGQTLCRLIRRLVPRADDQFEKPPAQTGMPLAPKILYSRKEAAAMLSISTSSLDELIAQGRLKAIRKGRHVMVHRSEMERWAKLDMPHIWRPKRAGKTVRTEEAPPEAKTA